MGNTEDFAILASYGITPDTFIDEANRIYRKAILALHQEGNIGNEEHKELNTAWDHVKKQLPKPLEMTEQERQHFIDVDWNNPEAVNDAAASFLMDDDATASTKTSWRESKGTDVPAPEARRDAKKKLEENPEKGVWLLLPANDSDKPDTTLKCTSRADKKARREENPHNIVDISADEAAKLMLTFPKAFDLLKHTQCLKPRSCLFNAIAKRAAYAHTYHQDGKRVRILGELWPLSEREMTALQKPLGSLNAADTLLNGTVQLGYSDSEKHEAQQQLIELTKHLVDVTIPTIKEHTEGAGSWTSRAAGWFGRG